MDGPSNVSLAHGDTMPGLPEYKAVSVFLVLLVYMHTPTNCYLVSLALADLIVLVAAGLSNVSDSLVGHWVYGHADCLGINVSSSSILAFTVERAQTVCTVAWAKWINMGIWGNQRLECGYKVSHDLYLPVYLLDFTVFFVAPLLVTMALYGLIERILFWSPLSHQAWQKARQPRGQDEGVSGSCSRPKGSQSSRKQATRLLAVVVLLFAMLWTPYRTLVLLDSFLARPLLDHSPMQLGSHEASGPGATGSLPHQQEPHFGVL
uniref:Thyrotropin-releasing hormone receptor n=1 Tax=Nannospalax galili TaxID=1026970 RepID=A0A8C6WC00_NANGA